ncbi:hypothetical protein PPERSA_03414 [Pseudocohnilembus persalinus]|uniref:Uncharacterized protein n=1 Tax=Pseudocohnilembus persalinus TaxID=266149 RepID=A0A0V0QBI9_PSEPJ|nr:hypothetical protein PPERSA_03414 [Pseudocohnilembus persalinus]|eukprot:KRW99613.1 hypothetical protein PPERSA_03414 [Pseudocohnilembus persalinus]
MNKKLDFYGCNVNQESQKIENKDLINIISEQKPEPYQNIEQKNENEQKIEFNSQQSQDKVEEQNKYLKVANNFEQINQKLNILENKNKQNYKILDTQSQTLSQQDNNSKNETINQQEKQNKDTIQIQQQKQNEKINDGIRKFSDYKQEKNQRQHLEFTVQNLQNGFNRNDQIENLNESNSSQNKAVGFIRSNLQQKMYEQPKKNNSNDKNENENAMNLQQQQINYQNFENQNIKSPNFCNNQEYLGNQVKYQKNNSQVQFADQQQQQQLIYNQQNQSEMHLNSSQLQSYTQQNNEIHNQSKNLSQFNLNNDLITMNSQYFPRGTQQNLNSNNSFMQQSYINAEMEALQRENQMLKMILKENQAFNKKKSQQVKGDLEYFNQKEKKGATVERNDKNQNLSRNYRISSQNSEEYESSYKDFHYSHMQPKYKNQSASFNDQKELKKILKIPKNYTFSKSRLLDENDEEMDKNDIEKQKINNQFQKQYQQLQIIKDFINPEKLQKLEQEIILLKSVERIKNKLKLSIKKKLNQGLNEMKQNQEQLQQLYMLRQFQQQQQQLQQQKKTNDRLQKSQYQNKKKSMLFQQKNQDNVENYSKNKNSFAQNKNRNKSTDQYRNQSVNKVNKSQIQVNQKQKQVQKKNKTRTASVQIGKKYK